MCQGVIMTGVSFNTHKSSRFRTVIFSGIGSHSELMSDNQTMLKKKGYNYKYLNDEVLISFESDFNKGWKGNYSVEESNIGDEHEEIGKKLKERMEKEWVKIVGSWKLLRKFLKKQDRLQTDLVDSILNDVGKSKFWDEKNLIAPTRNREKYNLAVIKAFIKIADNQENLRFELRG